MVKNLLAALKRKWRDIVLKEEKEGITEKFIIESKIMTDKLGLILRGTVLKGIFKKNREYMLGPDKNGKFIKVKIFGMHENMARIN